MSNKAYWPNSKGLTKNIRGKNFYLGTGWDIAHGKGWFCQVFGIIGVGFGFHKKNKFTAVRNALKDLGL